MTRKQFCEKFNITEDQFFGRVEIKGGLSLSNNQLTALPDGFNPTVGGNLYSDIVNKHIDSNVDLSIMSWQNGRYILVDGIFSEVISKRGNVYKVKKIASSEVSYIVTDGNGKYSHGETIKEAKEDLIFKIGNRSKDEYRSLTTDSVLTFEDAVVCYRVITGACQFGVKDFLTRKAVKKKSFKVSEIITLTQGEYGSETFKNFFTV